MCYFFLAVFFADFFLAAGFLADFFAADFVSDFLADLPLPKIESQPLEYLSFEPTRIIDTCYSSKFAKGSANMSVMRPK